MNSPLTRPYAYLYRCMQWFLYGGPLCVVSLRKSSHSQQLDIQRKRHPVHITLMAPFIDSKLFFTALFFLALILESGLFITALCFYGTCFRERFIFHCTVSLALCVENDLFFTAHRF